MTNLQLYIHGASLDKQSIQAIYCADEPQNSWRNSIFYFLQNWLDDTEYIEVQTSGSTGTPKNYKLRKSSMLNSAKMTNHFFGLSIESKALLCLPAAYIAGKMMMVRAIAGKYTLMCVEPSANPFDTLTDTIDFTAITPYQLYHSAESLKTLTVGQVLVGGGAVSAELETMTAALPSLFFESYGMTETCSHIALRAINGKNKSKEFKVLEGISIRLDERNCLAIRAPHLLEEEIQTNDIVNMLDNRSFLWLGRADFVINTGGVKIHPEQVERKMAEWIPFPFFLTSLPDKRLQNKLILLIEQKPFSDTEITSLQFVLSQYLDKYELPKETHCMEAFVYSDNQKILRKESLARYLETCGKTS